MVRVRMDWSGLNMLFTSWDHPRVLPRANDTPGYMNV